MAQQILLRRGTALQWTTANPILAQGEQGLETDTNLIKIGDGSTTWTLLSYTSAIGLLKANNLSDLANVVTARTNLGLGTLATQNGTFSGTSSGTNTGDNAVNSSSQPVNTNLTSLSGLTYSSLSFIKMTAAGTFTLDTNTYLTTISGTTNYIPKFSGSGVLVNSELYANGSELIWGISGANSTVNLSLRGTAGGYYNNLFFYGETFSGYGLQISIGTYGNEMLLGANQYRFRVGGVDKMWLNGNGRLLLNTTTDSGYLLDVNGTTILRGKTIIGAADVNNATLAVNQDGANTEFYVGTNSAANTQRLFISQARRSNYGDMLIGLNLTGQSGSDAFVTRASGGGYSGINFSYDGNIDFYASTVSTTNGATVSPVSRINVNGTSGSVGVGTNSPIIPFQTKVTTNTNIGFLNRGANISAISSFNDTGSGFQNLHIDGTYISLQGNSNGNVLINTTTNSTYKLDVNGTIRTQNGGGYYLHWGGTTRKGLTNTTSPTNALQIGDEAIVGFYISTSGNLLLNTTTDSGYRFDVNGTGRFVGALKIDATTASTSTTTGALVVAGGLGVGGTAVANLFDGKKFQNSTGVDTFTGGNGNGQFQIYGTTLNGMVLAAGGTSTAFTFANNSGTGLFSITSAGIVNVTATTTSTSTTTGALVVAGGVGIAGALYTGAGIVNTAGHVYLPNNTSIYFRNNANSAYLRALTFASDNNFKIGEDSNVSYLLSNYIGLGTGSIWSKVTIGGGNVTLLNNIEIQGVDSTNVTYYGMIKIATDNRIYISSSGRDVIISGKTGLGINPTATLHLKAGTATANTAPLKFTTSGAALLTTPEQGVMEVDSSGILYYTPVSTRKQIAFTSDITGTNSGTNTGDQTITLTGAVTGSGTGSFTTTLASSIVGISNLSATGTPSSTTYLRGDNTWATISGGSGITIGTTTITSGTDKKLLYNNSNVVDESTIYFDGTNTGFGTSSPQARIDIVGDNGVRFLLYGTGGTAQYLAGLGVNIGQGTNSMGFFTGQNSDFTVEQATAFENYPYTTGYTTRFVIARSTGHAGFNVISPTAAVHIKAGTTTVPPLKINSGSLVTTISGSVNDGALEYASSHLYFTIGSTRYQLDQQGGGVSDGDKGDVVVSSSGTVWTLDTVTANKGGTGQTSYAVGDLLFATGTTNLGKLAAVATGNVLISGGVTTAPSWGKVGLTTHVSGTLSITNGGTGITSAGIGSLLIGNGSTSFNTLVGNTTTTKKYLTQTGDGVDSDDPVWESLETAGIPWITYSDTATWNGTAPSGATTHEYRYYQIGKMVFGFIRLEYATAGISNTTLTLATNSFPVISKPSNCSNGENLTACTGYIDSSNIGSPPATRCWMEASANTSGFVVKFVVGSQSAKFAMCSFTYLTA